MNISELTMDEKSRLAHTYLHLFQEDVITKEEIRSALKKLEMLD